MKNGIMRIAKIITTLYALIILIVLKDVIGKQPLSVLQLVLLLLPLVSALSIILLDFVRSDQWKENGYLFRTAGVLSRFSFLAYVFIGVLRVGLNHPNAWLSLLVPFLLLVAAIFEGLKIYMGRKHQSKQLPSKETQ